jgi:tripartite ATP-independent transporter DctM subunit
MTLVFLVLFIILIALGMPVAFALLAGPAGEAALHGESEVFTQLMLRLYYGIDSFPLMALPFFVLAGEIMNRGGITEKLVNLSQSFIGHFRGGLAQANIATSILFAGLSGSAVADTSAVGAVLIPAMERNGYTKRFAAAVTAASSVIGPIIPPSGIMIMYAFMMDVSVAGLFAAGVVPGIVLGVSLMVLTAFLARVRNYPVAGEAASWSERGTAIKDGILPLLTPVIMLGGILLGIFTPTEAAAIAVGYAVILAMFIMRTISVRDLGDVLGKASVTSGVILLLVGAAVSFASVLALTGAPQRITDAFLGISENPLLLLFLVNILLLIIGMFLDAGPAILILGPILSPIFIGLDVHPLHFAIIMCVNVTVGLATPPMGLILFVAAGLTDEPVEAIAKEMLPYLAVEIAIIFVVTFVPALSLTLPRVLGFL